MPSEDIVLDTLKEKYFDLCREEDIGQTSAALTKKIDNLERRIREMQPEKPAEPANAS